MNDETTKAFVFLLIFWTIVIVLSYTFATWTTQFTTADLSSMTSTSRTEAALDNLWSIMTFSINTRVMLWLSLVLDSMAVLTLYVVLVSIFK